MRVRALPFLLLAAALALGAAVYAQIEGERGVPPIDTSSSYEVTGITVDVVAKTATEARLGGWRLAQRKAWQALWAKTHGGAAAPGLSDAALDGLVAGIVVDDEQIGPTRYVARLGVLFDRARTGEILGVSGQAIRSAPLLVIPVEWTGGGPISFEARSEWQKAWARFRSGASPIDYVRVSGTGADPLLLTFGQAKRPGRRWWRALLDQYGAADVVVPQVRLERRWPGGPVIGHFSARFGPDNREIAAFDLRVPSSEALPAMLDEGVRRIDAAYADALRRGVLRPDLSLIVEAPVDPNALIDNAATAIENGAVPVEDGAASGATQANTVTIQFDTPDAAAVGAIEAGVRGTPGVQSFATTSLALGGVSVMRVTFAGDIDALRAALSARGLRVEDAGGVLRIRRPERAPAPAAAAESDAQP